MSQSREIRQPRVVGNVAYIPLTRGYEAVVDLADLPIVGSHNWYAVNDRNKVYAYTNFCLSCGRFTTRKMHRVITGADAGVQVDHWDGDGLNNRRKNLREATNAQNAWNSGPPKHNTSGFKGVYWHRKNRKWVARIAVNKKLVTLGSFSLIEDAHNAFCEAAARFHGQFARFK